MIYVEVSLWYELRKLFEIAYDTNQNHVTVRTPQIKWIIMSDDLNNESMYSDQCLNGFGTPLPSILTIVIT